jgi:hypothetical protein
MKGRWRQTQLDKWNRMDTMYVGENKKHCQDITTNQLEELGRSSQMTNEARLVVGKEQKQERTVHRTDSGKRELASSSSTVTKRRQGHCDKFRFSEFFPPLMTSRSTYTFFW